jgi:hypothetical protein
MIQTPGFTFPDDYFLSDSIVFTFSVPVFVESLVAVDFEEEQINTGAGVFMYDEDGALISFTPLLGDGADNSLEEVCLKKAGVKRLKMYYGTAVPGSGGVASLCYIYLPCNTDDVTTFDECSSVTVSCTDTTIVVDDCITEVVRTFIAEDACGNINDVGCNQTITLDTDCQQPDIVCPADISIGCEEMVPAPDPETVVVTDNCSATEDIFVTWVEDILEGTDCEEVIRRIYSATDECGNEVLCVQFITRDDTPEPPQLQLTAHLMMSGPMATGQSEMYTMINEILPEDHPYSVPPYNYDGPEHVTEFPSNIVDWVLVDLRDVVTMEIISQRSALVTATGDIVDLDGVSPLTFTATPDHYYVVICHRNHLDIISDGPVDFTGSLGNLDLTLGNAGMIEVMPGMWAMIKGDVNTDGLVNNTDLVNLAPLAAIGYSNEYLDFDVNMDGLVNNTDLVVLAPFAAIGYSQGF